MKTGTNLKKKRKSGFLKKMRDKSGQKIISTRRSKKRKRVSK
uniref:Ribosomal protein L34 n=1 Tax=Digenea simplex TaxID=945030 RepID=A0A1Z1MUS5_DIGSM|nr:ribosomal protein L34 [Digenea simplex]ARW69434.1 ribosomal protein L34 [Digenea simplex]